MLRLSIWNPSWSKKDKMLVHSQHKYFHDYNYHLNCSYIFMSLFLHLMFHNSHRTVDTWILLQWWIWSLLLQMVIMVTYGYHRTNLSELREYEGAKLPSVQLTEGWWKQLRLTPIQESSTTASWTSAHHNKNPRILEKKISIKLIQNQ